MNQTPCESCKQDFRRKLENLAAELDNAAQRHLRSEWQQERGRGLLDAAFAVQELAKEYAAN